MRDTFPKYCCRAADWRYVVLLLLVALPQACGPASGNSNDNMSAKDGCELSADSASFPPGFTQACQLFFDANGRAQTSGAVETPRSVEVFDLGALTMGDRVIVSCRAATGSQLDPMIALFDETGARVFWNDDINLAANNLDAAVDGLIRHSSAHYFLGVTNSNLSFRSGAFDLSVEVETASGLAPLRDQAIVLQWTAENNVVISGNSYGDVGDFDAAVVDATFGGRTDALKSMIVAIVNDDFEPYEVRISTTDDVLPNENFTTIFFSDGSTTSLFGLADDVDFFNEVDTDNAIVFLRSYTGLSQDLNEIAQAIANVVSHEIGHTLGLMHTTDFTTLMDTTGADETLLADQEFGVAELFDFPIGVQDAPMLLAETVGLRSSRNVDSADGPRCGTCGMSLKQIAGDLFKSRR